MASSKPLGDRSAPAGRQDRSETVSGQLSERSWRLLGPSRGAQGAFWDRLGPSTRPFFPVIFGGHIGEARKLIDFVVSDSCVSFVSCVLLNIPS